MGGDVDDEVVSPSHSEAGSLSTSCKTCSIEARLAGIRVAPAFEAKKILTTDRQGRCCVAYFFIPSCTMVVTIWSMTSRARRV